MRLLTILCLVLITGCSTLPKTETVMVVTGSAEDYKKIPLVDLFNEIIKQPYKMHVYDCSNKAANYVRALKKAGHDADIVVIKPPYNELGMLHAIVRINVDGKYLYVDPTSDGWSRDINTFGYPMWIPKWSEEKQDYDDYQEYGDRLHELYMLR